jgi:hypothetical protein
MQKYGIIENGELVVSDASVLYFNYRGDEMKHTETSWFREYTLRDGSTKIIKYDKSRALKDEMRLLDIKENDIFQMQLVEKPGQNN